MTLIYRGLKRNIPKVLSKLYRSSLLTFRFSLLVLRYNIFVLTLFSVVAHELYMAMEQDLHIATWKLKKQLVSEARTLIGKACSAMAQL